MIHRKQQHHKKFFKAENLQKIRWVHIALIMGFRKEIV